VGHLMDSWEAWHRRTEDEDDDEDSDPGEAELDD